MMPEVTLRSRYRTRSRTRALVKHLAWLWFRKPRWWWEDTLQFARTAVIVLMLPFSVLAQDAYADRIDRVEGRVDAIEKQAHANQVALAAFSGNLTARVDAVERLLWFVLGISGLGGLASLGSVVVGVRNRQDVKVIRNGH